MLEAEEEHAAARKEPVAAELDEAVDRLGEDGQRALSEALDAYAAACSAARAAATGAGQWATDGLNSVLSGQAWHIRGRRQTVSEVLDETDAVLEALQGALVRGLEAYEPNEAYGHVTTLHDGLAKGQKLRGAFGTRTKLAKSVGDFVQRVRVDGRTPQDTGSAGKLLACTRLELKFAQAEQGWNGAGDGPGVGVTAPWQGHTRRFAALRHERDVLDALLVAGEARQKVTEAAAAVPELATAPWQDEETESAVRALLRVRTALRAAEEPRRLIDSTARLLSLWTDQPGAAPALTHAREAVATQDADGYREATEQLASVREATRLRAAHEAAVVPVRQAFPSLAEQIVRSPYDEQWEQRLGQLAEAWAWSVWRDRIEHLTDPDAERLLRTRLAEADDEIRLTLGKLAAERAWDRSLGKLTGNQTTALRAYKQAVGRIKGKHQHRYRREAQTALREAQAAVPACVPPHLPRRRVDVPEDRPSPDRCSGSTPPARYRRRGERYPVHRRGADDGGGRVRLTCLAVRHGADAATLRAQGSVQRLRRPDAHGRDPRDSRIARCLHPLLTAQQFSSYRPRERNSAPGAARSRRPGAGSWAGGGRR